MMKDVEEKKIDVTDEDKQKVNDSLTKLKEVKEKGDLEEIKKVSEELSKAAQTVGMKMYQQEQAKADNAKKDGANKEEVGDTTDNKKDNSPIEGEVVDDNDEKK